MRTPAAGKSSEFIPYLGMDAIATVNSSMINALQVLIMDNQWRIRLAVVEQIGILAKQFGVEVF